MARKRLQLLTRFLASTREFCRVLAKYSVKGGWTGRHRSARGRQLIDPEGEPTQPSPAPAEDGTDDGGPATQSRNDALFKIEIQWRLDDPLIDVAAGVPVFVHSNGV